MNMTPIDPTLDGFGEAPSTCYWEPYKYKEVYRDNQRRREYRSEWEFAKQMFPDEMAMSNLAMLKFLRDVAADKWFRDRFGTVRFTVTFNRRRKTRASCSHRAATACGSTTSAGFTLKFPGNGNMNHRLTGLHELMHIVCHRQAHGPIFCSALLQVVLHYMGTVAGKELRRQFGINMVELVR